ncbi:hypothetical protein AB0E59_19800 [Lentzea sp. NPDC034063]
MNTWVLPDDARLRELLALELPAQEVLLARLRAAGGTEVVPARLA